MWWTLRASVNFLIRKISELCLKCSGLENQVLSYRGVTDEKYHLKETLASVARGDSAFPSSVTLGK